MPEGPEIRLAADALAKVLVGRPTADVFFEFDNLKRFETMLTGATVRQVSSRSKAMLVAFDNGWTLYSHNQLYGKWMVCPAGDMPQTNRQLRVAIHNETYSALLYSATDIEVLRAEEVAQHPYIAKLGLELLDEAVTVAEVAAQFRDGRFRRRQLSSLLLDQGFLAGLGNYLRTEILFLGGVMPTMRPMDCTDEQIERLAEAAVSLTRQSYQTGGITNDLALANKLKAQGVAYGDYRFWVFARQDKPCYRCGTPIVKDEAGGRRVYYCPQCQSQE